MDFVCLSIDNNSITCHPITVHPLAVAIAGLSDAVPGLPVTVIVTSDVTAATPPETYAPVAAFVIVNVPAPAFTEATVPLILYATGLTPVIVTERPTTNGEVFPTPTVTVTVVPLPLIFVIAGFSVARAVYISLSSVAPIEQFWKLCDHFIPVSFARVRFPAADDAVVLPNPKLLFASDVTPLKFNSAISFITVLELVKKSATVVALEVFNAGKKVMPAVNLNISFIVVTDAVLNAGIVSKEEVE